MNTKKLICTILATVMVMLSLSNVAFAEKKAPSELTWITSDPGTVRFKVVDYTNQYSLFLYKDGEFVYHSYCYYYGNEIDDYPDPGYLTVDYARYSMAELGDGVYTYKISAHRRLEDGSFETLSTSEKSAPLTYVKPPELAKASDIKFKNNLITWNYNDSNVDYFEVKLFYTYDGLDFYELGHYESNTNFFEVFEGDWEHFQRQIKLWYELEPEKYPIDKARLAVQIYSIPKDRSKYELSATDCFFLTEAENKAPSGEYSKIISLTIGSTEANINGNIESTDAPPKIVNNRTMLPIRIIAENLGAQVVWNADTRTVDISRGDQHILITIDSATAYVNGEPVSLDVTAFIEHDRTYLPVRFISENLGAQVSWNGDTRTVTIKAN